MSTKGTDGELYSSFCAGNRPFLFITKTVPTDAEAGYPPGAICVHGDGSAGDCTYINEGSVTSCDFNALEAGGYTGALTVGTDGTGYDVTFYSDTASNQFLWDTSEERLHLTGTVVSLHLGTQANTSGSGTAISTAVPGALRVFSDDGGASIADSVRGIQSRFLLTVDQTGGSIRSLQGQLKMLTGVDVTSGIYTAVQGYVELVGTHSAKTGSTFSCIDASAEITTALTVDSGGEFCGIHVETTGAGTITNNGTCAGVLIDKASGAASWPAALLADGPSVIQGFRIGTFVGSAGTTTQVLFATTQNVYSDGQLSTCEIHGASNANLTSAYAAHCLRARHVVNCTTAAHETYGVMGQLVVKDTTLSHMHAGVMGTFEGHTSGVVVDAAYTYGVAAIIARVGGGAAITATTCLSGVSSILNGAAVASGTTSAFSCDATSTADWDYGASLANCTRAFNFVGACVSAVTAGSSASNLQILIHVDGSAYALAVCAVGS